MQLTVHTPCRGYDALGLLMVSGISCALLQGTQEVSNHLQSHVIKLQQRCSYRWLPAAGKEQTTPHSTAAQLLETLSTRGSLVMPIHLQAAELADDV